MSYHQNQNRNSSPDLSSAWHAQAPPPPPSPSKQPHGRRLSYIPQGALNIQPGSIINDPSTSGGNLPIDTYSPSPDQRSTPSQISQGRATGHYQPQQQHYSSNTGAGSYHHQPAAPPTQYVYHQQQPQYQPQHQSYQQTRPLPPPAPSPFTAPIASAPYNQFPPSGQPTHHHSASWAGNHHQQQYGYPQQFSQPPSLPQHPQQIQQPQYHQQAQPPQAHPQAYPNPVPNQSQIRPGPATSSVGSIRRNLPQPPSASPSQQQSTTPTPSMTQPPVPPSSQISPSPATLSRTQTLRNAAEDIMSRGPPRRGAIRPIWSSESLSQSNSNQSSIGNSASGSSLQSDSDAKNAVSVNGIGAASPVSEDLSNSVNDLNLTSSSPHTQPSLHQSTTQVNPQEQKSSLPRLSNANQQSPILRSPSPSYAGRPKRSTSTSVPPLSSSSTFNQNQGPASSSRPVSRRSSMELPGSSSDQDPSEVATFVRPPSRGPREDVRLGRERRQSTEIFIRSSSPNPERMNGNGSVRSSSPAPVEVSPGPPRSDSMDSNRCGNAESIPSNPPARYDGFLPQSQTQIAEQISPQPITSDPTSTNTNHHFAASTGNFQPPSNASRSQPNPSPGAQFQPQPPQIKVETSASAPVRSPSKPQINAPSIIEPTHQSRTADQVPSFNFSGPDDDKDSSIVVPKINLPGGDDDSSATPMISISSVDDDAISESGASSSSGVSNGPSISISHSGQIATPQRASSSSNAAAQLSSKDPIAATRNGHSNHQLQHQAASPSSIGSGQTCGKCGKWSGGRVLNAMNQVFHPACFTCNHCSTNLEHVAFYEFEGKPYCHFDFHELFSIRCFHCRTPIVDERFIRIKDDQLTGNGKEGEEVEGTERFYHELHFFCANCGDPFLDPKAAGSAAGSDPDMVQADENGRVVFGGMGFVVKNGYAYCERCHKNLHYPRCKTCKLPILTEVLTALGSKYHPECFTCDSCGNVFQDERMFVRGKNKYDEECCEYSEMTTSQLRLGPSISEHNMAFSCLVLCPTLPLHVSKSDKILLKNEL